MVRSEEYRVAVRNVSPECQPGDRLGPEGACWIAMAGRGKWVVEELEPLYLTAVWIGFIHCICGPDHYVPFVAMSRAGSWSLPRTLAVTAVCGLGHIASSALLGLLAAYVGFRVFHLERLQSFEETRGGLAAWALLAFGLMYGLWGLRQGWRAAHSHSHSAGPVRWTPWALFTLFVFGPCEPLIPILIYPAAQGSLWPVVVVTLLFAAATLATMLTAVCLIHRGSKVFHGSLIDRYSHAMAGLAIAACGCAILFGL